MEEQDLINQIKEETLPGSPSPNPEVPQLGRSSATTQPVGSASTPCKRSPKDQDVKYAADEMPTDGGAGVKVAMPSRKELRKLVRQDVRAQAKSQLREHTMRRWHRLELPVVVTAALLAAFALGYWGFASYWLVALIASVISVYRSRIYLLTMLIRSDIQQDALRKRIDDHKESCEWLNTMSNTIWKIYGPALSNDIKEIANVQLAALKLPMVSQLTLKELSLGSEAPRLVGARSFRLRSGERKTAVITEEGATEEYSSEDGFQMDVDIEFVPKLSDTSLFSTPLSNEDEAVYSSGVIMEAKVGPVTVPIAVQGIAFRARARIEIAIMAVFPVVKTVELCLYEVPQISFTLRPLNAVLDVMDVPGLSHALKAIIEATMKAIVVDPNRVLLNVRDLLRSAKEGTKKIKEIYKIAIQDAQIDDEIDAEASITVESRGQLLGRGVLYRKQREGLPADSAGETNSVHGSTHGEACHLQSDNTCYFVLASEWPLDVTFKLFHSSGFMRKERLLGVTTWKKDRNVEEDDAASSANEKSEEDRSRNEPKISTTTCSLHLEDKSVGTLTFTSETFTVFNEDDKAQPIPEAAQLEPLNSGVLRLTVVQVKELPLRKKPYHAYCEISLLDGGNTGAEDNMADLETASVTSIASLRNGSFFRTKVKKSPNAPVWDTTYDLLLSDVHSSKIRFLVKQAAKGDVFTSELLTLTKDVNLSFKKDPIIGSITCTVEELLAKDRFALEAGTLDGQMSGVIELRSIVSKLDRDIGPCGGMQRKARGWLRLLMIDSENDVKSKLQVVTKLAGNDQEFVINTTSGVKRTGVTLFRTMVSEAIHPVWLAEAFIFLYHPHNSILIQLYSKDKTLWGETSIKLKNCSTEEWITISGPDETTSDVHLKYIAGALEKEEEEDESEGSSEEDSIEKEDSSPNPVDQGAVGLLHCKLTCPSSIITASLGKSSLPKNLLVTHGDFIAHHKLHGVVSFSIPIFNAALGVAFSISPADDKEGKEAFTVLYDLDNLLRTETLPLAKKAGSINQESSKKSIKSIKSNAGSRSPVENPTIPESSQSPDVKLARLASPKKSLGDALATEEDSITSRAEAHSPNTLLESAANIECSFEVLPIRYIEPTMYTPTSFLLKLTLVRGISLMAVDHSGTSDPYVTFRLNNLKLAKSKTIKKTVDPEWNEHFRFYIVDIQKAVLVLEARDWNRLESSESLGQTVLYLCDGRSVEMSKAETNRKVKQEQIEADENPDKEGSVRDLSFEGKRTAKLTLKHATSGHLEVAYQLIPSKEAPEAELRQAIKEWKEAVAKEGTGMIAGALVGGIGMVGSGAGALVSGTGTLVTGTGQLAFDATKHLGSGVMSGMGVAASGVVGGANLLGTGVKGTATLVEGGANVVSSGVKGTAQFMGEGAMGAASLMTGGVKGTANLMTGGVKGTANIVGSGVKETANMASKPLSFAKKGVTGIFGSKKEKDGDHGSEKDSEALQYGHRANSVNSQNSDSSTLTIPRDNDAADANGNGNKAKAETSEEAHESGSLHSKLHSLHSTSSKTKAREAEDHHVHPSLISKVFRRKSKPL